MNEENLNIKYEEYRLENGLNVVLSEDHSIPSAVVNTCYKVGSKDEDPDKRGYAHLFEHLMYEGSKNLPGGAYDKFCQMAGGENNGYTNEDKTNYFIVLPSHQLELGLWLESDRMLEFSVTERSLMKQKEVVLEEKKQIFDNKPYGTLSLELPPRLFKKGGYSWDTIGFPEDIESASLEHLRSFFNKFYVPSNAVLSITGDIDPDNSREMIQKYFGTIPSGNSKTNCYFRHEYDSGEIKDIIFDNIQFPGIFIAYRIPGEDSAEHYNFDIISDLLSSGESSRLYKTLVYDKQLCSEAGCYADIKEFAGALQMYAILMPGAKTETVEKEIDKIIFELVEGNISDRELNKVKNRIETRHAYRLQSIINKADMLAHYKAFYNDPGVLNSLTGKYLGITKNQIIDSANKYLRRENRVILQYLPKK